MKRKKTEFLDEADNFPFERQFGLLKNQKQKLQLNLIYSQMLTYRVRSWKLSTHKNAFSGCGLPVTFNEGLLSQRIYVETI